MSRAQGVVKRGAETISKSAKASAKVFEDARKQADALLGSVDPLYAAQVRYDKELARAQQLMKSGALTAGEMAKIQAGLKTQLDSVARSFGNTAGIAGRTRMGFTQLSFQVGDVAQGLAMGTRASTIFAQQSGQVIQSLQLMGGEGSKFLRFLGGPWGIAISTAAVVLAPFAGKLFETGDEIKKLVDKMREQAQQAALNERADAAWKNTIDGLTQSIRKRREEQEKQLKTDIQSEQDSLNEARRELDDTRKKQRRTAEELQDALKNLAKLKESPPGLTEEDERGRAAAIERAEAKARRLAGDVNKLKADVADAERNVRGAQASISERAVEARLDDVKAATDDYTRTLGSLRDALQAGSISQKEFEDRLEAAKKKLEDVKDAAKETAKAAVAAFKGSVIGAEGTGPNRLGSSAAGFGQFMPSTWLSYFNRLFPDKRVLSDAAKLEFRNVRDVAVAVIDKATDDYVKVLEAAGQKITAANLYTVHLLGARDARKLFSAAPSTDTSAFLSAQVLRGNPFLRGTAASARAAIGTRIGDSSGAVSSATAAIDREIEEQAKKSLDQQNAFIEARDRFNQQILSAQGALAHGIEAEAKVAEARVLAEEQRNANAINADLAEGKYGDATSEVAKTRAEQLLALNHSLAVEKKAAIQNEKRVALEKAAFAVADQQRQFSIEALHVADQLATTQADHRRIQLDILDAEIEQRRLQLEHEKQLAIRNGATADEIRVIQDKIDHLGAERAQGAANINRNTQGPLEAWKQDVPKTLDEITEKFEQLQVDGIEGLADALTEVAMGTRSLKEAFTQLANSIVADIIRMTVRMMFFRAISALGGLGGIGKPNVGAPATVDLSTSSLVPSSADFSFLPGFATGGSFTVGGRGGTDKNILSINGIPRARVSAMETVSVGNDNGPMGAPSIHMPITIDATGADPAELSRVRMELERLRAEFPYLVVQAYYDAASRNVIR